MIYDDILVGNEAFKLKKVTIVLLETKKLKKPTNNFEVGPLMMTSNSRRGNFDRGEVKIKF